VRRKKPAEPNHMDAPLFRDFQEEKQQTFHENAVLERDVLPQQPPESTFSFRMVSYLIDVVLCLLLNLFVLRLILSFSDRNISNLVTFSLIPLLFVFLSFSVLYFWLFTGLIHKSLGNIIAEKLRENGADSSL